jgi:protein gp37
MGEKSAIEWTQNTWNPWQGCHKVSPGCKFCYMYRDKERYGQDPKIVVRSKPPTFNAPLKWKEPALVFTCSWSDWFVEEADDWRTKPGRSSRPHRT